MCEMSHLSFSDRVPFAVHDPSLFGEQAPRQPWVPLDTGQPVARIHWSAKCFEGSPNTTHRLEKPS